MTESLDSLSRATDALNVEFSEPSAIYGPYSTFSAESLDELPILGSLTDGLVYWESSLYSLLLLIVYCMVLARYRSTIIATLKCWLSLKDSLSIYNLQTTEFRSFINVSLTIWYLTLGATIATIAFHQITTNWYIFYLLIGAILTLLISAVWVRLLNYTLSRFDFNRLRWVDINNISKFNKSIGGIILAPVFIIFSLLEQTHEVILYATILLYFYHFLRIIIYFRHSRFSIFQSFLYLCTVEVAPLALAWGIISRGNLI